MEANTCEDHDKEKDNLGMYHFSDFHKKEKYEHILEKMDIQPEVLDLLQCLPVCKGVHRDLWGVQEFFSLVSGTMFSWRLVV